MAPAPRDLCSLAEVREAYGLKEGERTDLDTFLEALISDASELIEEVSGQEFVALNATLDGSGNRVVAPEARVVGPTDRNGRLRVGSLYDLTAAAYGTTPTAIDIATITLEPYDVTPRRRPARRLLLPYVFDSPVTITARWGWPTVPGPIRRACVWQVVVWAQRDLKSFSETFNLEANRLETPRALASSVYDIAFKYADLGPLFA